MHEYVYTFFRIREFTNTCMCDCIGYFEVNFFFYIFLLQYLKKNEVLVFNLMAA